MATVSRPSRALQSHAHTPVHFVAEFNPNHENTALPSSKPSASRDQSSTRESNYRCGRHNQDLGHAIEGPSILRMRAAFLLELENTHLPAKAIRQLEHRISPCTPGPSSFSHTGYHEFKTTEGDSRLRKCFLHQLEITDLDPEELHRIEERTHPPHPNPLPKTVFSHTSPKLPAAQSTTMDPQEESSSAASRREPLSHRYEDPQNKNKDLGQVKYTNTTTARKSSSFKTRSTTETCKIHQVCYSSQYTRPAAELLAEVLEVRYPAQEAVDDDDDVRERGRPKCCWMRTLAGYLRWT